jgi:dihydroxyacetone kinase-like protein
VNADVLRTVLMGAFDRLGACRDELRALDAAIGDGDLGITVGDGAAAVIAALGELPASSTPKDLVIVCARSFGSANPATFSTLIASGLLAAAPRVDGLVDLDRDAAVLVLTAMVDRIADRGGARRGDKTMLDAGIPALDALVTSTATRSADVLDEMITAAADGVCETANAISQRGRAAWVGERGVGHPDGGATAVVRFLEALRSSWPDGP